MENEEPIHARRGQPMESYGLRLLLSVEEAAEALAISRTAVFRLLREGRLRSVKIDKRRLIAVDALHEFVKELAEAS